MSSRCGLLIGSAAFDDARISNLVGPEGDVSSLAEVLRDPSVGGFEIKTLLDATRQQAERAVQTFFRDRHVDDLLLLFYSGHGLKNEQNQLFFATTDTDPDSLESTAVSARFVNDMVSGSRARSTVILLDCCYSGAFSKAMLAKGDDQVHTASHFDSRGRVVLTASDAYQYARDGESVGDAPARSLFTRHMVEGLRTGDADLDGDGQITVDELYFYVERKVVDERRGQRPAMSALDQAGRLVLAESRRGRMRMLPDDLVAAASSPYAQVRTGAVEALARFLDDSRTSAAREAETLLEGLRADDSRRVSQAATEALLPRSAAAERPDESPTAEPPTERRVDEAESTPRPAQVEAPAAAVERGSLAVADADTAMADHVGPVVDLDTRHAPHDCALPPPTTPRRRRRGPALVAVAGALVAASALKWTGISDWLTSKPKVPAFLTTKPSIGADLATIDARNRSSAVAEFLRSSSTTTVLEPPSTAAGVPSQRTVIRVGVPTEMGALDPHRPDGVNGAAKLVYEPLVRQTATGYEPVLALSWTWSSDMKELTMRLRPGVKFQDGRSFDAQAAASNIQRWEAARSMTSAAATGDEVEKIFTEVGDPLMIRLRLHVKADPLNARRSGSKSGFDCFFGKVNCEFFDLLDHLSELLIVSPSTFNVGVVKQLTDIVGTGPWRITTKDSTSAEFVPNLKYWGPQPNQHRLLLTTIVDSGAREAAVKNGEVDFSDDESLTTLRLQLSRG